MWWPETPLPLHQLVYSPTSFQKLLEHGEPALPPKTHRETGEFHISALPKP